VIYTVGILTLKDSDNIGAALPFVYAWIAAWALWVISLIMAIVLTIIQERKGEKVAPIWIGVGIGLISLIVPIVIGMIFI